MVYTWENKHQGRYFIKEGLGRYTRKQQGHSDAQKIFMEKKNNSRNNSDQKEQDNRRFGTTRRNIKK